MIEYQILIFLLVEANHQGLKYLMLYVIIKSAFSSGLVEKLHKMLFNQRMGIKWTRLVEGLK